ncbi:MAG: NAD(P)H-dependent oxidoreductase [Desulfovibrionaceae bacterium]|nr:NAD(P)H-dependent oxidoreductase [Desulfovibrionaceae bacterium]
MSKILVAYFSASGVTAKVATKLATALGAESYEIKPRVAYTAKDLDWQDKESRTSLEMHDPSARPELADTNAPVAAHEIIFLGFPIWWYVAPKIVHTFLEHYDFSGKTIVLFATSGGSGFGKAKADLQQSAPKARFVEGKILNGTWETADLAEWAKSLHIL